MKGMMGRHQCHVWRGSSFDVGFQHGRALRRQIIAEAHAALRQFAGQHGRSVARTLDFVVAAYEPLFRDRVPRAIEEIKGLAKGAGLSYAHAFFAATRDGLRLPRRREAACTSLVCGKGTTVGDKVLMGQTKDTTAPLTRYHITRIAYDSGQRVIGLNYAGWFTHLALTSDGLALVGNALYAASPRGETAPFSLLKRLVVEKQSVQEVLDGIRGLVFENSCVQIGDATGHLVCIENVAGHQQVRDVSGRAFGHANSVLSARLRKYEDRILGSPSSPLRQKNVQRLLDSHVGRLSPKIARRILADHTDFPLSICRHRSAQDPIVTTAAFLANLTDREVEIAIGHPCVAPFQKYTMGF